VEIQREIFRQGFGLENIFEQSPVSFSEYDVMVGKFTVQVPSFGAEVNDYKGVTILQIIEIEIYFSLPVFG
jgi:hypothetical protein